MGRRGHFLPALPEGIDHFNVGCLAGEAGKLVLEEDEAQGVFQDAAFRVLREVLLEVQLLDPGNHVISIADLVEDLAGLLGVELFELRAPLQIAGAGHRIGIARDHPTAEVLAARGETKGLGGPRAEDEDPVRQPLGVDEFAGVSDASHMLEVGIAGILLVEAADGGLEPLRVRRLESRSHCVGLMAEVRYAGKKG